MLIQSLQCHLTAIDNAVRAIYQHQHSSCLLYQPAAHREQQTMGNAVDPVSLSLFSLSNSFIHSILSATAIHSSPAAPSPRQHPGKLPLQLGR